MRVVVVDDDFMVARLHARLVDRVEGFTVAATARSAAEARTAIHDTDPDIVLLDIHLPDQHGLDLLRDLRDGGLRAEVVMITAERDASAVRQARHLGALHYLIKPFESSELVTQLERARQAVDLALGETEQDTIDRLFGGGAAADRSRLPKGLSPETLQLVEDSLATELSASECAEGTGLSRVTARRYLEHLLATGRAQVRLQYGAAGRPERRYYR